MANTANWYTGTDIQIFIVNQETGETERIGAAESIEASWDRELTYALGTGFSYGKEIELRLKDTEVYESSILNKYFKSVSVGKIENKKNSELTHLLKKEDKSWGV